MTRKYVLTVAVLAFVCSASFTAGAQEDNFELPSAPPPEQQPIQAQEVSTPLNQVTLGTQWVGGSNTNLFGRYNGFTEEGFDIVAGFNVAKRDAWDSGGTWYYDVSGINLDIQTGNRLEQGFSDSTYANTTSNDLGPMAELSVKLGKQGFWGVYADYDAISYTGNVIDSIYTVNGTIASLNNNLPAWGGASNDPLTIGPITNYTPAGITPAEKPVQVGTRRDIVQIGGQVDLGDDWVLSTDVRHEHKEGSMEQSMWMTDSFSGLAFAMPVDYDTDRFNLQASYSAPDMQAILQYTYSQFTDNNQAVVIPYPISGASISPFSGPPAQSALYSLPPSNAAHYFTGMFADNLAPGTRITLNGRLGVELQNSTFPANSADPNLSSNLGSALGWFTHLNSLNQGTSATSPDDVAWVYQGNLAVNSQFAPDLTGRASYGFDGRTVHLNQYLVWSGAYAPDSSANVPTYVVPQDWFNQTATVELAYRILPASNTKLIATYSFNDIDRTNAQVDHSITNTESLELTSLLGSDILGRLTYEHADRSGTLIYGTAWGNLETGVPSYYGTPSGAYYQAPMTSNSVTARADFAPAGNLTGGFFLKYTDENYNYPSVPDSAANCTGTCSAGDWTLVGYGEGIKEDYNLTAGPDISYRPSHDVNLHAYYTYERIYYNNLGNGACAESTTDGCTGSAGYFQNTYASNMHTAGLSGDWQATPKLKLKAEYNLSSGVINFGEFNGVMVQNVTATYQNVVSYPNIDTKMNQVRLTAEYQLADNIQCSLLYQYSDFSSNDWDFFAPPVVPLTNGGTEIGSFTPGYPPPSYSVSTIGTSLKFTL